MTSRPLFPVTLLRLAPALLLLLAAGCSHPGSAPRSAAPATPVVATAAGAFDDDAHQPTAIELTVIAAGTDHAKQAAVARDLLATIQDPKSSPALGQEAAQHLGYVMQADPSTSTLAILGPMLSDPAKVDYARLALDRVPGESVNALYLSALPKSTGRVRLALVESVAARGLTAAVPLLAPGLNDVDPALATATAQALGRIGGPAALAALESTKDPLAPAILNARLAAAAKINATTVANVAGEIYRNAAAPLPQRSAALRQLINANPAQAVEEINAALTGTESAFHAVAIHAVSTLLVPGAAADLAGRLGRYTSDVQVALIAALGTRGDAGAIPSLLKTLDATNPEVRLAAIEALGRLPGSTEVAQRLATLASGNGAEAKAAIASLARLNGPGIDDFIREKAAASGNELQTVFIQQLAARNLTEAIPFLLGLRASPDEKVRLEALDALRGIAANADQPAIIAWTIGASAKTEQTRAVRALITIILRDSNVATRADTVIGAIKAGDVPARLALLPVLARVGGPAALATAEALARDANGSLASAATAELARWPDATALPVLVRLATDTSDAGIRLAAVQGSARFLAGRKYVTPAERSVATRQLLTLPLDPALRITLLDVLSRCADPEALAAAKLLLSDPATKVAAQDAIDAITSNLAGRPDFTASAAGDQTALMSDGKPNTYWSVPNAPGGWLRADLHHSRPFRQITLDHGRKAWDWPEQLEVCISDDPEKSGDPIVKLEGTRQQTVITLPAGTRGRYVWLRQQGTRVSNPWTVDEFILE